MIVEIYEMNGVVYISCCQLLSLYLESSSNLPRLKVAMISRGETYVTYCI